MQRAFFLISATTGCVDHLRSALDTDRRVKGAWKVASGEYDIIALVESEELGDFIDFREFLGGLERKYPENENGQWLTRKFVHKASFNLVFPDNDLQFAAPVGPRGTLPSRGVSDDMPEFA